MLYVKPGILKLDFPVSNIQLSSLLRVATQTKFLTVKSTLYEGRARKQFNYFLNSFINPIEKKTFYNH